MTPTATQPPEGYERVAWYYFPSFTGPWKPSKVHLRRAGSWEDPLCGARRRTYSKSSTKEYEFRDHEQDVGLCKACWKKATKGAI